MICISIRISLSPPSLLLFSLSRFAAYIALGSDLNLRPVAADVEDSFARTSELFGVPAHLATLFIDAPKSVAARRRRDDDVRRHVPRRIELGPYYHRGVRLDGLSISPINRTRPLHTPCISRAVLFGDSIYVGYRELLAPFVTLLLHTPRFHRSEIESPLETHLVRNIFM